MNPIIGTLLYVSPIIVPNKGIPLEKEVVPSIGSTYQQKSLFSFFSNTSSVTISALESFRISKIFSSTNRSYFVSKLPSFFSSLLAKFISFVISLDASSALLPRDKNCLRLSSN